MARKSGFLLLLVALFAGCKEEPVIPIRESIGTMYVTADETPVLERADASSPTLMTVKSGEAVTILGVNDQWVEVRLDVDRSGWVARDDLTAENDASKMRSTATNIQFRRPPNPVFRAGSAHGEIKLEAAVDQNGNVTSVRTLSNTTGSPELEQLNRNELLRAKFYPLISKGRKTPFVYVHRVEY